MLVSFGKALFVVWCAWIGTFMRWLSESLPARQAEWTVAEWTVVYGSSRRTDLYNSVELVCRSEVT
jgi:hypothetical protein